MLPGKGGGSECTWEHFFRPNLLPFRTERTDMWMGQIEKLSTASVQEVARQDDGMPDGKKLRAGAGAGLSSIKRQRCRMFINVLFSGASPTLLLSAVQ